MSMTPKAAFGKEVQRRLDRIAAEHQVPGATLAVLDGDDLHEFATGVLNANTGVEATPDSLFQIGSVTKVFTATLVMQLVDDGIVKLDEPARAYLPGLRFADPDATQRVTVRNLLTHTSGVDGDFFQDFGRGDDGVERYVAACANLPSVFPVGEMFSYCNAGFVVLGRLVEVLTGEYWRKALRSRLLALAGAEGPVILPEEAILHRVAVGHDPDPESRDPRPVSTWMLPPAMAPAGSAACARARDLLAFSRVHLEDGAGTHGARVLSPSSVAAMQEPQVDVPSTRPGDEAWGLGWDLDRWNGERIIGHGGGTMGQTCMLQIAPNQRLSVAVLTNAVTSEPLFDGMNRWIFGELRGIEKPPQPGPPTEPPSVDAGALAGVYERTGVRWEIEERDGGLAAHNVLIGEMEGIGPDEGWKPLIPASQEILFLRENERERDWPLFFLAPEEGRPRFLFDGRVTPRALSDPLLGPGVTMSPSAPP